MEKKSVSRKELLKNAAGRACLTADVIARMTPGMPDPASIRDLTRQVANDLAVIALDQQRAEHYDSNPREAFIDFQVSKLVSGAIGKINAATDPFNSLDEDMSLEARLIAVFDRLATQFPPAPLEITAPGEQLFLIDERGLAGSVFITNEDGKFFATSITDEDVRMEVEDHGGWVTLRQDGAEVAATLVRMAAVPPDPVPEVNVPGL